MPIIALSSDQVPVPPITPPPQLVIAAQPGQPQALAIKDVNGNVVGFIGPAGALNGIAGRATALAVAASGPTLLQTGPNALGAFTAVGSPVSQQTGASAAGIGAVADANAKVALTALQNALATLGWITAPA